MKIVSAAYCHFTHFNSFSSLFCFQTPVSVDGSAVDNAADPVLEAKYREKLFTQVGIFSKQLYCTLQLPSSGVKVQSHTDLKTSNGDT